ncbi:MAG: hypothetical protein KJZ70_18920, partial [Bryobacterales bacterium]|nr:hypothetical protein [Bryobacterales bacterium]
MFSSGYHGALPRHFSRHARSQPGRTPRMCKPERLLIIRMRGENPDLLLLRRMQHYAIGVD